MRLVPLVALLCSMFTPLASAQQRPGRHSLTGTVTDPRGAGIPNADVIAQQHGTHAAATQTRTDSLGKFNLILQSTGSLEIIVSHQGFVSETIPVAITDRTPAAPLNIQMKLATLHEALTVSGTTAEVSTDSANNLD